MFDTVLDHLRARLAVGGEASAESSMRVGTNVRRRIGLHIGLIAAAVAVTTEAHADPFPTDLDSLLRLAFAPRTTDASQAAPVEQPAPATTTAAPGTVSAAREPTDTTAPAPLVTTPAAPHGSDAAKAPPPPAPKPAAKEHWYDHISIGGYTQFRYNRLYSSNDELRNEQADKSIGGGSGFFIRRARLRIQGNIGDYVSIYLQPDFAAGSAGDLLNLANIRDWYADINVDKKKEYRFRVGQSKVPYGFENMQSSQNRAPLDRSDPINSALKDERDLGVFFYYAPDYVRKRFKYLVDSGLKGSGDYGMFALGVFNGQNANQKERNDNRHVVARVAYPFLIGEQFLELGLGGYAGEYYVKKDDSVAGDPNLRDARFHASVVLYPQPFGLQAEYNVGIGPELDGNTLKEMPLHGGYVMAMYRLGGFLPYVRVQSYEGGKKHELNAPRYEVREIEAGIEWQIIKPVEITTAFMASDRTVNNVRQVGELLRVQLQINY